MTKSRWRALGVCLALGTATAADADTGTGAISFSQPGYFVAQDAGVALVILNRTGGATGSAIVTYGTVDSSALAGTDYTAEQGTLSWADGDWAPKAFMVPISALGAGGVAFTVNLLSASGATFGNPISTTVFIGMPVNDVVPTATGAVQFSQSIYSVAPDASSLVATLNRVQGSSGDALVSYTTQSGTAQAGSAFAPSSGVLTWADGDCSPKSFLIPLVPNSAAGQSFSLVLLSASGATFGDPIAATVSVRQSATDTVTLSWTAPTQNTDGSALTDLAGYYVFYGTGDGRTTNVLQVADPNASSVPLPALAAGTWYFAAMAYDTSGAMSSPSSLVSTTIQ